MSDVHAAAEPGVGVEPGFGDMYNKLVDLTVKAKTVDHVASFRVGNHTFKVTLVNGKSFGHECVYIQAWDADVPGDASKPRGSYGIIFSAVPSRRAADVRVVRYDGRNRIDSDHTFLLMFKTTFTDTLKALAAKLHDENQYLEGRGIYLFREAPATAATEPGHSSPRPGASPVETYWPNLGAVAAWAEERPRMVPADVVEHVQGWSARVTELVGDRSCSSLHLVAGVAVAPPGQAETRITVVVGAVDDAGHLSVQIDRRPGSTTKPTKLLESDNISALERALPHAAADGRGCVVRFQRMAARVAIGALTKHVNLVHAAAEPGHTNVFERVANYCNTNHHGKLNVRGYREFAFSTEDGHAFLRWSNAPVVTLGVFEQDHKWRAVTALGLYRARNSLVQIHDVTAEVEKLAGKSPAEIVARLLRHAVQHFDIIDVVEAAAEPRPAQSQHEFDPAAPDYFKAFVALDTLKGKRITRPGHPWSIRVDSTWYNTDNTDGGHMHRRMVASAKLVFESGDVKETISISSEDHARVFKVVVGGNHLGNGGRVFLELTAADLKHVTKPAQFLWVLADKLQIVNSPTIPERKSAVKIPERYLEQATTSYLSAFLQLTSDTEHPDYDEDSGNGPDLGDSASIHDIDAADAAKAREYMRRFLEHVYPDIAAAEPTSELSAEQVGHDAFLSSGGYGSGFLDRRYDRDLAQKLDRACDAVFSGNVDGSAERDQSGNVTKVHIHF